MSCAERAAAMKATIDPLVASADRSCKTDADCARATLGNACFGNGCTGVDVSKASAMAVTSALKALQDQDCDAAFRAGCVGPGITNCPAQGLPVCIAGQCQDSGQILTGGGATQCRHAPGVDVGGPGACGVGDAYLDCEFPSGAGCECVTNDTSCAGCGADGGATCQNRCSANEYAVACGGPPAAPGAGFTYADPPANCRTLAVTPGGVVFSCCPCE